VIGLRSCDGPPVAAPQASSSMTARRLRVVPSGSLISSRVSRHRAAHEWKAAVFPTQFVSHKARLAGAKAACGSVIDLLNDPDNAARKRVAPNSMGVVVGGWGGGEVEFVEDALFLCSALCQAGSRSQPRRYGEISAGYDEVSNLCRRRGFNCGLVGSPELGLSNRQPISPTWLTPVQRDTAVADAGDRSRVVGEPCRCRSGFDVALPLPVHATGP